MRHPDVDLKTYQQDCLALVEEALDLYLPGEKMLPQSLHKAMRYSVFAGGKRIRPVLMIAACEAAGGERRSVLPAACALEMIHTYSLIHDDLPAMDDDDFRRGRPTNHKVFGEAQAILAGDALLTEAFNLLARPDVSPELSAETRLKIVHLLARSAGSMGMVAGQVVDMESEGKKINFPTLEYIHTHKTGALILAAIQIGALVAGADETCFKNLSRYGEAAGLAFQVADDILDIVGDQAVLGKDVGSDQERGKATYPAFLGLEEARERARDLRDMALEALQAFAVEAEPLRQIARYIIDRSV
jgi:geranylgeranyl diphosphate synthase type II